LQNTKLKSTNRRVNFFLGEDDYKKLQNIAAQKNNNVSETMRELIMRQLNVAATTSDIDFIRRQIREELETILQPQINRLAKLLMRIGMMTISMCYFTSKIVHIFVPLEDRRSYEELMAECKHNAAAYLNMRDASLDAAFREFEKNK